MPSYSLPRKLGGELRLSLFFVQLNFFMGEILMSNDEKKPTIGNRMGFIETINDTLTLYRGLLEPNHRGFNNRSDLSFDEKMLMRKSIEDLKRADLYFMHEDFAEILTDYGDQFDGIDFPEMRFSEFTRPCSRVCYMRINHLTNLILDSENKDKSVANYGYITEYYEDKTTAITLVAPLTAPRPVGAYHPDRGIYMPENTPEEFYEPFAGACFYIAGAFELINNPKFVISKAAGTRAQRKQMKREQDIPLEAWHQIAWNVDDDTIEVNEVDRGGWHMPLHYTRGHTRKAEPHHKNVMYKDGKPYKWIHGFWSGHPAYGIKKGYHAPKITAA